jgi:hypothetical protein
MDLATFERENARNRKAYEQLREQIRRDYAGQYVLFTDGKVIAVAPTVDGVREAIAQLRPVPEYYLVFAAEEEPSFDLVYDLSTQDVPCHVRVGQRERTGPIGSMEPWAVMKSSS